MIAHRIPILVFEVVAFTLAARKTIIHLYSSPFRGRTFTMQSLEVTLRDSVIYFLL
jgi:hypothetical protein